MTRSAWATDHRKSGLFFNSSLSKHYELPANHTLICDLPFDKTRDGTDVPCTKKTFDKKKKKKSFQTVAQIPCSAPTAWVLFTRVTAGGPHCQQVHCWGGCFVRLTQHSVCEQGYQELSQHQHVAGGGSFSQGFVVFCFSLGGSVCASFPFSTPTPEPTLSSEMSLAFNGVSSVLIHVGQRSRPWESLVMSTWNLLYSEVHYKRIKLLTHNQVYDLKRHLCK